MNNIQPEIVLKDINHVKVEAGEEVGIEAEIKEEPLVKEDVEDSDYTSLNNLPSMNELSQSWLFHMNQHEENETNFFQCNHRQSWFEKKEKLENHIQKKHRGGFKCETCGKKFLEQSSLKKHGKMHFREQRLSEEEAKLRLSYFCDNCGRS